MSELNPYAPPADVGPGSGRSVGSDGTNAVRQGDVAVFPVHGSALPDRCVVCNAPAGGYRLRKTFYWHHPAIYLAILAGALIYVILAMVVRKSARVELGLCEAHRARRRNGLILAWSGMAVGLVGLLAGAAYGSGAMAIGGFVVLVALPIVGSLMARAAYPTRIDDRWVWLKVGRPFLDGLPPG